MAVKFLDKTGLGYFWSKIKAWCNATFAAITHSHAWSTITGKPTTISGYGITDAKIDNETITLGSNSITPLTSHQDISGKVNKSGDTMTGVLNGTGVYISGTFAKKHPDIVKGTNPSSVKYWTLNFCDKNGIDFADNAIGQFETSVSNSGVVSTYIRAMKNTAADTSNCQISCIYDTVNNTAYTAAPTPATADNSTKIATTAFVKSNLSSYLPLFGGKMTGIAYLSPGSGEYKTDYAIGDTYSSNIYMTHSFYDKNNSKLADILYYLNSSDSSETAALALRVFGNPNNPDWNFNGSVPELGLRIDPSGDPYGYCPTPVLDSNSTAIATTNWVRNATGNTTLTAANVSGTVAIKHGGTGSTTRTGAISSLFSEEMTTSNSKHFLTINNSFTNAGWLSVADAKTLLGLSDYLSLSGGILTGTLAVPLLTTYASNFNYDTTSSPTEYWFYGFKDNGNHSFGAFGLNRLSYANMYRFRLNNPSGKWADLIFDFRDNNEFYLYTSGSSGTVNKGFSGNASTATTLATSRTIQTNLASTSSASFNGSANVTPGVTGVLPIANGGTGSNTKNFVDLSSVQTISGNKTFTNVLRLIWGTPIFNFINTSTDSSSYIDIRYYVHGSNNDAQLRIRTYYNNDTYLYGAYSNSTSAAGDGALLLLKNNGEGVLSSCAGSSGTRRYLTCGTGGTLTWNGQTVQTSSDERLKTSLMSVPDEILEAWESIEWGQFQYLDAVKEKGSSARLHVGLIAQEVDRVFRSSNLDILKYGILCHEVRETAVQEVKVVDKKAYTDENGIEHPEESHIERDVQQGYDQWQARYVEALCMEAAYQRRKNKILENHISELEKRLAKLEDAV